jgi:hypothetical protein
MSSDYVGFLTDYMVEAARGKIPRHSAYRKWGRNPDLDIGTENVWEYGGDYTWQTVADNINITSSSDNDNKTASTGWVKCIVYGLNADYKRIQEVVTLSGTDTVQTLSKFIIVYRCNAGTTGAEVGSGLVNAGDITGTFAGTGNVAFFCAAGLGGTMQLFDIVPANHRLEIYNYEFSSFKQAGGNSPRLTARLWKREFGLGSVLLREDVLDTGVGGGHDLNFKVPIVLPAKCAYWVTITTDQNNTVVGGSIDGILLDET